MVWKRVVGGMTAVLVVIVVAGGIGSLITQTIPSSRQVPALVVLALVAVSVLGVAALGSKSSQWLSNPYW